MKYISRYVLVAIVGLISIGQGFSFTSSALLNQQLNEAVFSIEQIIEKKGEGVRTPILKLLGELKKSVSNNERSLFIVEFVMDEISKTSRLLTKNDFSTDYENIDIVMIPEQILATVVNQGPLGQRNDDAFEYLAGFIFGDNTQASKIAMTSPVTRAQIDSSTYETAFIMPNGRTLENLPDPRNDRISIKEIPSSLQAVWRFSGYTTESIVDKEWKLFTQELEKNGIIWYGLPTLAQYDGPWVSQRSRRNELWVSLNSF